MLEINNLNISVLDKNILSDINLTINDGEIAVLMGPNGVGKSSIARVLMGDRNYNVTGSIKLNGEEILNKDITSIARMGIYLVNQNPIQVEGVTNANMLRTALSCVSNEPINIFAFNKELERICESLELDKKFIHQNINEGCSGGERKKIELMHMWVLKPKFIILDEIDSGLDVDALKVVVKNINEYYKEYKPSILIITHQERLIESIDIDHVHVLSDHKIVKSGDKTLANYIIKNGFKEFYKANIINGQGQNE